MNEHDWLTCNDPTPMLRYLQEQQVSERKLRILACACCRRIWNLLPDPRSRAAVEVAERFAEGEATPRELARARNGALVVKSEVAYAAYWAANTTAAGPLWNTFAAASAAPARHAVQAAGDGHKHNQAARWEAAQEATLRDQVALIREVMGNPFRRFCLDPLWLAWEGGTVVQLARGIHDDRAFERMPVLGDALEEAGCDHQAILDHCRSANEHIRGCWVVDLILGKA